MFVWSWNYDTYYSSMVWKKAFYHKSKVCIKTLHGLQGQSITVLYCFKLVKGSKILGHTERFWFWFKLFLIWKLHFFYPSIMSMFLQVLSFFCFKHLSQKLTLPWFLRISFFPDYSVEPVVFIILNVPECIFL